MGRFSKAQIDWSPFRPCALGEKAPYPRSLQTPEGLGDRLRFVAFAEKQAMEAFRLAARTYADATPAQSSSWLKLADEEAKHLSWLLRRMEELKVDASDRPQSLALWNSFDRCETADQFAVFMANAEERGRVAGEQFFETLKSTDPVTAEIFRKIAEEEVEHIRIAEQGLPPHSD